MGWGFRGDQKTQMRKEITLSYWLPLWLINNKIWILWSNDGQIKDNSTSLAKLYANKLIKCFCLLSEWIILSDFFSYSLCRAHNRNDLKGYECIKIFIAIRLNRLKGLMMYNEGVALKRKIVFPLFRTINVCEEKKGREGKGVSQRVEVYIWYMLWKPFWCPALKEVEIIPELWVFFVLQLLCLTTQPPNNIPDKTLLKKCLKASIVLQNSIIPYRCYTVSDHQTHFKMKRLVIYENLNQLNVLLPLEVPSSICDN